MACAGNGDEAQAEVADEREEPQAGRTAAGSVQVRRQEQEEDKANRDDPEAVSALLQRIEP
jgi:hypothetical protein